MNRISILMIICLVLVRTTLFGQDTLMTTRGLPTSLDPLPDISTVFDGTYSSTDVRVFEAPSRNQTEPSIAVNPANASNFLAGAYTGYKNQTAEIFKLGYFYTTVDLSGGSWNGSNDLPTTYVHSADPTVAFDASGNAYYCHLNGPQAIPGIRPSWEVNLQKSTDGGATWTYGDMMPSSSNSDKPWMTIDRSNSSYQNRVYIGWTEFSYAYGGKRVPIRFSYSGSSTSKVISDTGRISYVSHGVNLATGPSGEVYAVWAGYDSIGSYQNSVLTSAERRMVFNKSTNGGDTWGTSRKISDANGIWGQWSHKNPGQLLIRVNSFPAMAVDLSEGSTRGTIYVVWADKGWDNADIYLIKSTNGGNTWLGQNSAGQFGTLDYDHFPVRVNDDATHPNDRDQWFPAIAVNPYGVVTVVFYDSRNDPQNQLTEVWAARSTDAGLTWNNFRISDVRFKPVPIPGSDFMGDYISVTSQPGKTVACWMDNRHDNILSPNPNLYYQLFVDGMDTWPIDQTFPPLKPKQLSGAPYNDGGVNCPQITWAANPEPNLLRYRVERSINTAGGPPGTWSQIGTVSAGTTTYIDYGITFGGGSWKVYYRVKAENTSNLVSAASDIITVTSGGFYKNGGKIANGEIPKIFLLNQNYPNPFNPTTTIEYSLPEVSHVFLRVYDMLGREVKVLVNSAQFAGNHSVTFDASHLPSGVYTYTLQTASRRESKKMILQK